MTTTQIIFFKISTLSNLLPIITLTTFYNKLSKPFKIFFLNLIIGNCNDLLGYVKQIFKFHFNFLIVGDIYHIIDYGVILYFFYILNNKKYLNRYLFIYFIGLVIQIIDWFFITKFKYNTIYSDVFLFSVCCYLYLDKINFIIINTKTLYIKSNWLLLFFITMSIYYSYCIFTLSLYCLNIPLNIKIEPSLYSILNIANTLVNITLTIIFTKLFNRKGEYIII